MQLTAFTKEDFDGLYAFMHPLWHDTYKDILPKPQIDFLLDKYFSQKALEKYKKEGYRYYKIDDVGVLVFVERDDHVFMDKLYLLPNARGKGYAAFALNFLTTFGKDVQLNVNQANTRAFRCYQKNGFEILEKQEILLGNGMVNYDFAMIRKVK